MCTACLIEEGYDAVDEILEVVKAERKPSILTTRGIKSAARGLFIAIRRAVASDEREVEAAIRDELDKDWRRTTPEGRRAAFARVRARVVKLGPRIAARTEPVFDRHGTRVIAETRAASIARFRFGIDKSPSRLNRRMLAFIAESQTNYITDEYGRRASVLSARARKIVAEGMAAGMFRDPLTRKLHAEVGNLISGRSQHYFDTVSRIYVNRGRTLSSLAAYEEEGIKAYQFVAVRDARSSSICRMLHGKTWSVASGLRQFDEIERLRDPEKIRQVAPFVQEGVDRDGNRILYYKAGDRRRTVARIEESALGQRGKRGRYSRALDDAALQRAGITQPPLHGSCRSTIVPVV